MSDAPTASERTGLRAEHDALATRLESRLSVVAARRGLVLLFFGLIGTGTCAALALDRWGPLSPGYVRKTPPGAPLFLYVATVVTIALLGFAAAALLRSRRLARDEAALFERLKLLRRELELET